MKQLHVAFIAACAIFLGACSNDTYEPREIQAETDVCAICNMSITHVDYAAQSVLKNGDTIVFDDIGCLMAYREEHGDENIGASYIRDFESNAWLNIQDASYVYDREHWTPMNYGVLAFVNEEAAQAFIDETSGDLLAYTDLTTFNWGVHEH